MVIGRRRATIAMAVVPALAVLAACGSSDGAGPATTAALTTVSVPVTTTVGPVIGGAAASVFSTLDGYVIEAAPGGTADDLLNTVRGIRGSGDVVDAVDVRLVSPTAGGSAALVVSVVLKSAARAQSGAFGSAVVGSLGSSATPISVAGGPAEYVEGPDPEGGVNALRAIVIQRDLGLLLLLSVQGDRTALEQLATALAPRLASSDAGLPVAGLPVSGTNP
jgi:hypothetical protein